MLRSNQDVKTSEGWQAKNGLLLPSSLVAKGKEDRETLKEQFKRDFDRVLSEQGHRTDPYYLLFKSKFDGLNPLKNRQAFSLYEGRPPFIAGSLVFWVDNSRGLAILLWEVVDGQVRFNVDAAKKLKGILRDRASA
jgi:hypothetical protein